MIDRNKLLEEMEKLKQEVNMPVDIVWNNLLKVCIDTVKEQPKVGEWIPCSERLPENEKLLYWTTHEDGTVMLHGWLKTNGFIYNWEVDDLEKRKRMGQVVAWMPIFEPEPYKE